ncbi:MAG: TetR/AcrR family transcriptional regulator [Myxococcota bacterium]
MASLPLDTQESQAAGARRTGNVRAGGRSARVVETVLRTTVELLGEVGETLRIDDIARRSGVNKTTIYRRWPTREELLRAALLSLTEAPQPTISGNIRDDMVSHVTAGVTWLTSPIGRGIARVMMKGDPDGELRQIICGLREQTLAYRTVLLDDAVARGELPQGTDTRLVAETIHAGIYSRIIRWNEDATPDLIEGVIDLVLAGAKAGAAIPRKR